jgi:hypothetical protein
MTIKVIKPFKGVPDGEVHPRQFNPGDIVSGSLAAVALAEKWAKDMSKAKAEETPPPATTNPVTTPPPAT